MNLPESVLHLSYILLHLTKVAAAVKRGLYFPQVRHNLHRLMLLAVVVAGTMIESAKLGEFDLMDIDRDEQSPHYLSLFAVVGKYAAPMWYRKSVGEGFDCEFEKVVHRKIAVLKKELLSDVPLVFSSGMTYRTSDSRSWTVAR